VATEASKDHLRAFSQEELASFDGKAGRPACIAYDGLVYDVSDSFLWKEGRHQVLHDAGCDLTEALASAPHGEELLGRAKLIGRLRP
jgi:predicted heme/steroid binding protein